MKNKVLIVLTLIIMGLGMPSYSVEIPVDAKLEYNQGIDFYKLGMYERAIESFRRAIKIHPDYIITTGAHTGGPMCCIAKLLGAKVIYIETLANLYSKTITGRLVYHIADLFIVQWESMLELYPDATYGGWIY